MTDRDRWGLRGPVQSGQLQRIWYAGRCGADRCETEERGDSALVEFRRDGSLVRRWYRNPDGSELTGRRVRAAAAGSDRTAGLVEVSAMNTTPDPDTPVASARGSDRVAEATNTTRRAQEDHCL
jgi:hypothetical protein